MSFRIAGLDPAPYRDLFGLSGAELGARGVVRMRVEEKPGAPCRISLDDAEIGEDVLLLSHAHQPAETPYAQQGPIFVRADAQRCVAHNHLPPALQRRTLSLRAFDAAHMMVDAALAPGDEAAAQIERMFASVETAYIHAHYATRGCFAAAIERA